MKVIPGEFVLVKGLGNTDRPKLVKCSDLDGRDAHGVLDIPNKDDDSKSVSFDVRDIVANLGKYPRAGSVFGVKIEPLLKTVKDKRFGEIRIYQKLNEDQLDRLMFELKTFYSELKHKGHTGIPYQIEIRNPQGKYQGYYKYLPKSDYDILCAKPDANMEGLQYIFSHEHAHGIWGRRFNARQRNRWIKLYHQYVALSEASEDDLQQIMEEIQGVGNISEYLRDADDETRSIVKACLRYINQVHGLSKHHLDTALSIQESLEDYWPVTPLDFSQKEIAVTDYATKSPEELFAESYAFWYMKRPLPKKADSLLTDSLSKLTR